MYVYIYIHSVSGGVGSTNFHPGAEQISEVIKQIIQTSNQHKRTTHKIATIL